MACIRDMYNEGWTQDLHRHPVLCIWSWSILLGLNKIPFLLYEQLFASAKTIRSITVTYLVSTSNSKWNSRLFCSSKIYNSLLKDIWIFPVLCIWSWSILLGLNKIPFLLYEQLFIYTTIWFKRNILLVSILSLSYYL
jgi:hypothetical protein